MDIKGKLTWLLLLFILGVPGLGACTESPTSTSSSSEEAQAPAETVATGIQFKAVDDQIYTIEPGEEIEVDGVLYTFEDGEVKATRIQQEVQTPTPVLEDSEAELEKLAFENANFAFKVVM